METLQPIHRSERIASLDVLRGVAVLGILMVNIQAFSMPGAAYINPTAYGDLGGANLIAWLITHVLFDMKFISIFSLLFGAGICVFADRIAARGAGAAGLHYRRTGWLLLFGLAHAYLVWSGDILVMYALCALWAYLLRNCAPLTLLIAGLLLLAVASALSLFAGVSIPQMPPEAVAGMRTGWQPDAQALSVVLDAYRGAWLEQLPQRAKESVFMETFLFLFLFVWRVGGMMLIGMALYRWGMLKARTSDRGYHVLLLAGVIGVVLVGYGVQQNFAHGFSLEYSQFFGSQFNYWGSVLMSLAYVSAVMLAVRKSWMPGLQQRFAAVGQMAFSNYIAQSLICTLLFYGHGLGWYGSVARSEQVLIVLAIWVLQLVYSPLWLNKLRYGPLEWAWRSLTYWQRQPMLRVSTV